MRDLDRLHPLCLRAHRRDVLIDVALRAECDDRGDALRHVVRLDEMHLLLGQAGDLLCRENHVAVVGQQDDVVVGDSVDGVEQVLGGWVHRLAAFDDGVNTECLEDLDQPLAGHDRDHADAVGARRLGGRRGLALEDAAVLARHVADVELEQLAVPAGDADHTRRVVRVHVHLHELGLTDNEHRVAQRLDVIADSLHVE